VQGAPENTTAGPHGPDDPDNGQDHERHRLADLIESRRDAIARRWEDNAARGRFPAPSSRDNLTLTAAVGDYLAALVGSLRRKGVLSVGAAAAWRAVSDQHELTSSPRGFELEAVVRQLLALRNAILAVIRESDGRDAPGDAQTDLVSLLIDAGISQVLASYTHHRDRQERQLRAEYIGFITHELRNPLTTVMVAAARLGREEGHPGDSRSMALVQRNLKRVANLIDTFLLTEQMDADRIRPHPVDMLVGDIVDAAVEPALRSAHRPEVSLSVAIDPAVVVKVDPTLTIAALQNVVTKAVQYSDERLVTIQAEDRGDRLILDVGDHCRGIPPEAASLVLEPFRTSHPGKPAPGLGLALSRRIMEEQGGNLHVELEEGGGCHFRLVLPKPGPQEHGTTEQEGGHGSHPDRR
jgi:signal transduction histidine kinase